MNQEQRRESVINKIIAGVTLISVGGTDYLLKASTKIQKYIAQVEYDRAVSDLDFEGHLTRDTVRDYLISLDVVPKDIDEKLSKIDKDIDKLKHQLFLHHINPEKGRAIRHALKETRSLHAKLFHDRHLLDHLTVEGYADSARMYKIFSFCLFTISGNPVENTEIIEKAIIKASNTRISSDELRVLARTEPWRSIWNAYGKSIFGSTDFTEDQRILILYSQLYDSVYKAHETPADYIINDDDLLDGWMIEQRKEQERASKTKKQPKGGGINYDADEIYLFQSQNDTRTKDQFIEETEGMNSFEAKMIKSQRKAALKAKGVLKEQDLPDIQRNIQIQAQKQLIDKFRKG